MTGNINYFLDIEIFGMKCSDEKKVVDINAFPVTAKPGALGVTM